MAPGTVRHRFCLFFLLAWHTICPCPQQFWNCYCQIGMLGDRPSIDGHSMSIYGRDTLAVLKASLRSLRTKYLAVPFTPPDERSGQLCSQSEDVCGSWFTKPSCKFADKLLTTFGWSRYEEVHYTHSTVIVISCWPVYFRPGSLHFEKIF